MEYSGRKQRKSDHSSFATAVALNSRGQIVLEYVLLLSVAVGIAALIVSSLASRDSAKPGIIISKWCEIQKLIRIDNPGDRSPPPKISGCD
jgi:hypothetical protein